MSWGSKEWANEQLKYAIATLDGKTVVARTSGLLNVALIIHERLEREGFWWQARILNCHIHRFQRNNQRRAIGLRRIMRA